MQNVRLFLFAALGFLLLIAWTEWQKENAPPAATGSEAPAAEQSADVATPQPAAGPTATPGGEQATDGPPTGQADAGGGGTIRVVTDVFEARIDTRGARLSTVRLRKHSVSVKNPEPYTLMTSRSPVFMAESGLVGENVTAPDHTANWRAAREEYRLAEGEDELIVPLTWTNESGLTVTRRYIFRRNSYLVDTEYRIENSAEQARRLYAYAQLRREPESSGQAFLGARSYVGGVIYTPEEKYEKIAFDDMRENPLARNARNGWIAMIQHYFLGAWIPPRDVTVRFYSRVSGSEHVLGMSLPWADVPAGGTTTLEQELFVGPKEQNRLDAVAEGLELTVDYGWFTILSKPLFIALSWIHDVVGNWGWSIILLVIGIKLVFFKLSETSYRSMARMRKLQPRMQQMKERFGDDRERLNQEMMKLYKEEKVNPLGGCLPILIQIPVFIALYWVLLESVELRQAPWILWINDLSIPDPYYVLPLLMGATMFLQQKLNPAPMDPIQQKVMMALPIVFTVFFLFFPAGLVLYWVTNNTLSIAQQWVITRRIEAGGE